MDKVESWFQEGLKFHCTGCGKCCTGSPGYVFLSDADLVRLADHFKLSPKEFAKKYTRQVDGMLALLDEPSSNDCIFLQENKCTAYESRPTQCRTFPWWIDNLRSIHDWNDAAKRCEGINHPDAPVVAGIEIETQVLIYLDNLADQ